MKATLLTAAKEVRDDGIIVEIMVWSLPDPLPPCTHRYKYRLFYGRQGERLIGYDNERGKGDHRHRQGKELLYQFTTPEKLLADFEADIAVIEGSNA